MKHRLSSMRFADMQLIQNACTTQAFAATLERNAPDLAWQVSTVYKR